MEDGRHWELSRLYQDFYDLQISLIQEFPYEAGNVPGVERSLPYMPGPVTYVTDNISNGRRANLDEYIKQLLQLGPHISKGYLVRKFFSPRDGDYEIDPEVGPDGYRLSGASQRSGSNPSAGASRQSSAGNLQSNGNHAPYPPGPYQASHQRGQASSSSMHQQPPNSSHYRAPSDLQAPPTSRQTPSMTPTAGNPNTNSAAIKIKVWFDENDCVVIRMPPGFKYADLVKKLRERRALERGGDEDESELMVEYRDEVEGGFYRIEGDDDLREALLRNPKLTLTVTTMR
jgi:bud emergence protein 1